MNECIKEFKLKYNGLRYSHLINNRKNSWWFTIPSESFINSVLYLMLINKDGLKSYILEIDTAKKIHNIQSRKEGVHLSGTYDLYFTLLKDNSIEIKYLTDEGYKSEDFTHCIIEDVTFNENSFISSVDDLKENLLTIESYLDLEYSDFEKDFAISLIQKGTNFIAYKIKNEIHFAPSRFVGYKHNCMEKHLNNTEKDGKQTTPIINALSNHKLFFNKELENAYIKYCSSLGMDIHNRKRQYWFFDFSNTTFESMINTTGYKEGKVFYEMHKRRERNRLLVMNAKREFKKRNNNKLFCEFCGFNFAESYGIDYIEAHHVKAVSEMHENEVTKIEDIRLVCSNCHRVIHSKVPHFTVEEFKLLILNSTQMNRQAKNINNIDKE